MTKKLDLKLKKVPKNRRTEVKEQIGELLIQETNDYLDRAQSPVTKEPKSFRKLSDDYALKKIEIAGSTAADMRLMNEMRPEIDYRIDSKGRLEFGLFGDQKQVDKADNHNKRSAKSKRTPVPKRRFIPGKGQNFRRDIQKKITEIIKDNEKKN